MISGIQWNTKSVVITAVAGIVILFAGYNMWQSQEAVAGADAGAKLSKKEDNKVSSDNAIGAAVAKSKPTSGMKTFPRVDLKNVEVEMAVPAELLDKAKNDAVSIEEKELKVEIAQAKYNVFYREAAPAGSADKVPLLLLHGMAFTSKNWVDIKTMQTVYRMGHRVVAVDLPGFGKTTGHGLEDKAQFLDTFIGALGLGHPIIVSPSMSGSFALPFVTGKKFTHTPTGYIPVAPVKAAEYEDAYKKINIPVVIVYGSKDAKLGVGGAEHLKRFPNSKVQVIKNAGHPCYIDQPDDWHKILYNFLKAFDQK